MARDLNHAFGPRMTNEYTVERRFQKFRSGNNIVGDKAGHRQDSVNEM